MSVRRRQQLAAAAAGIVAAAAGVALAVGTGGGDDGGASVTPATAQATATTPQLGVPVEDAAAQLFLVGFAGSGARDPGVRRLARRDWGGVVLERHNAVDARQVRALVRALRKDGSADGTPPPLIGIVQPGGAGSALPSLPPVAQADQAVPREAAGTAAAAAAALTPLGIELTLAPVADLAYPTGPMARHGFSDDAALASDLVAAAVGAYRSGRLASAPGSFPGQGAASQDPAEGPGTVGFSLEELRRGDLAPFAAAVKAGAPAILMSDAVYAAWDGVTPATLAPEAYDLLRRGLRFGGVAISGDLQAATGTTGENVAQAAVQALRAGADLLWVPGDAADQEAAHEAVVTALRGDAALRARAAQALARIALLRTRYGGG